MALIFVSKTADINYLALSTDIIGGTIDGVSQIGGIVYTTDDGLWYIVEDDLKLSPYTLPISISGGITIGAVSQGTASLTENWRVNVVQSTGLTDAQLRNTPVPVSGTVTTGGLTDAQLRNTPVPVSGTVTANTGLTQPLTDTQLRNTPVPISGTVTANTGLSQPLTDAQLRNTPVPVSGTMTSNLGDMTAISASNSSVTPLAGNATFAGAYVDVLGYTNISIMVHTDKSSAVNGLVFSFSSDGVNLDDSDSFQILADESKQYSFGITARYIKVSYTNGADAQGEFRLQTMLHKVAPKPSSHPVGTIIEKSDDAELVKAVLTAKTPDGLYKNMSASQDGVLLVGIDDIQADAGGRVRMSQLTTLGDYKILGYDRTTTMWNSVGSGTGTYANNKFNMSVTSGQYFIRQTRRFHCYFSGKSQLVEETFDGFAPQANVTKRVGYFSSNAGAPYASAFDGFWLESGAGTISLRSSRAGSSTLSVNLVDMTGYANLGEYKIAATWDNFTVIMFDFLWLGGAVLRLWVKTSYGFVLAHQFNYSGTSQDVFILSPNQPLRYEIVSTTGSGSFRYICSQVATEGSMNENGSSRFVDTGNSLITTSAAGTTYPLKSIRKAVAYRDIGVMITSLDLFLGSANDTGRWTLQVNPTLSAGLTYAALVDSPIEQATGNGTITVTSSGVVIAGGGLHSNVSIVSSQLETNYLAWLGSSMTNVMDEYVLCTTPISGSMTNFAGIGFKIY